MPTIMFAYMRPSELELSPAAEAALRANQYDIDAWKQNKMLTFNEKWTFDSQPDLYDEMHPAVKSFVARQKKVGRSEEHTSELQSLMRISYAVFCLKIKTSETLLFIITKHNNRMVNISDNK